jgi:iron(III) transport system ATP-binding protein
MAQLEADRIIQRYGRNTVVNDVSFVVQRGTIACLLGPSGCGKTTLLRCIAGFEELVGGEIRINGRPISTPGWRMPPEDRQIGMVFQDYALFPHLSIADNIGFGLRGAGTAEREKRVAELLEMVGLARQAKSFPNELSGGQQQRVALARALAPNPALVLLDEPFSNLDVDLRERLSIEVREILKACGTTAVLVTHDQREAFAMADEIGVMAEGRIQQWDSAYNLYHRPANRFVADFVGEGIFVQGTLINERQVEVELGILDSAAPIECDRLGCASCGKRCRIDVLLRPDDIIHDDASRVQAKVLHKAFRGAEILYTLELPSGARVLSLVPSHHNHALGGMIGIRLDVDHVVTFRQHLEGEPEPRPLVRG